MTTEERQEWLAARRLCIGGSDAPAVARVCPHRTDLDVWLDKLGMLPDQEETPAMAWGTRKEPCIADAYQETTGFLVERAAPNLRHPVYEFMGCNLDRIATLPDDTKRNVQIKTSSERMADKWGQPGTDEIPDNVQVQVQHEMAVSGLEVTDVAVLIGSSDFRIFTVQRNETLIARLIKIERDFWASVVSKTRPAPDWQHPSTPSLIAAIAGLDAAKEIVLDYDSETLAIIRAYQQAGKDEKQAEKVREVMKAKLTDIMGDAATATLGEIVLKRKRVNRKAYECKESSYITLTITDPATKKNKGVGPQ